MITPADIEKILDLPHDEVLAWLRTKLRLPTEVQFPINVRLAEGRLVLDGSTVLWTGKADKGIQQLASLRSLDAPPAPVPVQAREVPEPLNPPNHPNLNPSAPFPVAEEGRPNQKIDTPALAQLAAPINQEQLESQNAADMESRRVLVEQPDEDVALEHIRRQTNSAELKAASMDDVKTKMPSLWSSALGFAKSVKDTAKEALQTGRIYVPAEVANERRAICLKCDQLTKQGTCGDLVRRIPRPDGNFDTQTIKKGCGCFVHAKSTLVTSECPSGHWGKWAPKAPLPPDEPVIVEGM